LHAGAIRLEQAWSRALERDDVEALAAEWTSFLHAMASEVAHADRDLEDDLTRFELPLPEDDLIALSLESDEHARRTAEAIVLGRIAQGVDSLRRPTKLSADVTGRRITFFSSGAFAGVRDQLTLLSMLKSNPLSDRRLMLVNKAAAHGDPEAVLFHAAALLRRRGNVAGKVQSRILEASDRLAAGEAHDLGTLTILADAALRLFSDP
jgi:hypothetical protein